jgi:hypothetical protein
VSNQNCSTENSVKVLDKNEEEIRKEICRIFMEDDDFDIYMKEQIKKGIEVNQSPKKIFPFETEKLPMY